MTGVDCEWVVEVGKTPVAGAGVGVGVGGVGARGTGGMAIGLVVQ